MVKMGAREFVYPHVEYVLLINNNNTNNKKLTVTGI